MDYINTEAALELLGQSKKLYSKLVVGFINKYTNIMKEFYKLIEEADYKEAERLAHSIKGLCGNLGAEALSKIAKGLEFSFRDKTEEYHDLLIQFDKMLILVLDELEIIRNTILLEFQIKESSDLKPISNDAYRMYVVRLLEVLNTYKYSEIKEFYYIFKDYEIPAELRRDIAQVFEAIEHFDYRVAISIIESKLIL